MELPGADLNIRQKSRKLNLKISNFEFCLSFKSVPGQPPFSTTLKPKNYFLYVKDIFRILS